MGAQLKLKALCVTRHAGSMHLFIDESGPFIPLDGQKPRVSSIGALVVPDAHCERLFDEWSDLKAELRPGADEIKGSMLNESDIAAVCDLLKRYDVIFEVCCVDAGQHHASEVADFQKSQAEEIAAGLPANETETEIADEIRTLANVARILSQQEFIQAFVTIRFLHQMVPIPTNYYAQRRPKELGRYKWIIDAKGEERARLEDFWTKLILPALQKSSEREPFGTFPFGDFSYFERYTVRTGGGPEVQLEPGQSLINSGLLYQESLQFMDSRSSHGLQLVDILTNAATRLLNGRLDIKVAAHLGRLMVHRVPTPLGFAALRTPRFPNGPPVLARYNEVSRALYRASRPMVAKKYAHIIRAAKNNGDA